MHEKFWIPGDNLPVSYTCCFIFPSQQRAKLFLAYKASRTWKTFSDWIFLFCITYFITIAICKPKEKKKKATFITFIQNTLLTGKKRSTVRHASSHKLTALSYSNAFSADRSQIKLMKVIKLLGAAKQPLKDIDLQLLPKFSGKQQYLHRIPAVWKD